MVYSPFMVSLHYWLNTGEDRVHNFTNTAAYNIYSKWILWQCLEQNFKSFLVLWYETTQSFDKEMSVYFNLHQLYRQICSPSECNFVLECTATWLIIILKINKCCNSTCKYELKLYCSLKWGGKWPITCDLIINMWVVLLSFMYSVLPEILMPRHLSTCIWALTR